MKMYKIMQCLALAATFGLMACGDDSSSAKADGVVSCRVKSEKPFRMELDNGIGMESVYTVSMREDTLVFNLEANYQTLALAEKNCEEARESAKEEAEGDYEIVCDGKKVMGEAKRIDADEEDFDMAVYVLREMCEMSDGKTWDEIEHIDDEDDDEVDF